MRKLLFSMIIMACAASFTFAQSDDYNKVDIYAGFSHARVDFGGSISDFEGFNGVEGAVTGNISSLHRFERRLCFSLQVVRRSCSVRREREDAHVSGRRSVQGQLER